MFYFLTRRVFIFLMAVLGILYSGYILGFRINISESMPRGIWHIEKLTRPLKRGDTVWFCPPNTKIFQIAKDRNYIPTGSCPQGYAHLVKRVAALPGDNVNLKANGVSINHRLLVNSRPQITDRNGRPIPQLIIGSRLMDKEYVWLMSEHPSSFDSRYFGEINSSALNLLATPIMVW